MAEVAAAAWAVEEVISTTVQAGVGAYMVAKPTMPLKATFMQIATSSDDATRLSLCRSDHTISIVGNKAYIFGGETAAGKLAGNEVHVVTLEASEKPEPDYSIVPAIADADHGKVPIPRTKHAACAFNVCVAIFGGVDEAGTTIDEPTIWLFNTAKSSWETLEASELHARPSSRRSAKLFDHKNSLVLYGGYDSSGAQLKDVWHFDYVKKTWTQLPDAPVSTSSAAVSNGVLHLVSSTDSVSSDFHFLHLDVNENEPREWHSVPFPTNPLSPGPLPRTEAGLLPVSTGYGRNYLLYLFGVREEHAPAIATKEKDTNPVTESSGEAPTEYWSDLWTYQLPSSSPEIKATTNVYEAIKPAKIKDAIRGALGFDSGKHSWAEIEVLPPKDLEASEGKVHPGPRTSLACDVMKDGRTVVMWGGVNAKGEREGDGWMIRLE